MGDFFTQWRILGMLLLALACIYAMGWVKTVTYTEMTGKSYGHPNVHEVTIIPLILVSTYLILGKPRKRMQRKLVESVPTSEPTHV